MLKKALIVVAVLAVAAPGAALAKGKKAAAEESAQGPAAPIPYSQLAEEDAKLNGPAPRHHAARKKASKKAAESTSSAGASNQ